MTGDRFILEGRVYFQRQQQLTDAETQSSAHTDQLYWYSRDPVTKDEQPIGEELPPEVHTARVTREMLLPYIATTQARLTEIEQSLRRLKAGDSLALADRVAIAACGFGAALVGGCPKEIYEQGEQLALDILHGVDPSEPRASGAFLRGADLSGARMAGSDLGSADLRQATLRDADMTRANLSEANLNGADLSGANFTGARLSGSNLQGANLREADLSGIDLRWADLREADLGGATLCEADLSGADLGDTDLRQANLCRAELQAASLRRADLFSANLAEARLRAADLSKANLMGADLSHADLTDAILSRTNLEGALISEGQIAKVQYLKDTILPDGSTRANLGPNIGDFGAEDWYLLPTTADSRFMMYDR
jgi:uncharacterized protein YjbI with pentapeptide repeats